MRKATILIILTILIFSFGITYSIFYSKATFTADQGIAKFVFESQDFDSFDLALVDLNPGDKKEYLFSVSNTDGITVSDVTIEYEIIIKTYHFMPLIINLYKIDDLTEELIYECTEEESRNSRNELICKVPVQKLFHKDDQIDNYKLEITFPNAYSNLDYADLVDFLNLEIKSWQKI